MHHRNCIQKDLYETSGNVLRKSGVIVRIVSAPGATTMRFLCERMGSGIEP